MGREKNKEVMLKVLRSIRPYWFLVVLSFVMAAVTVALTLYVPILIGYAVDEIIAAGNVNFPGVWAIIKQIVIVIVITALSQWLMNVCNNRITFRVIKDIRTKAFHRLENLPLKYVDSHQYGDVVSRIVSDVDQFSDGLLMGLTQLFSGVITIIGTLAFMLYLNWIIALVVVIITPLSLFVARFIAQRTYTMFHKQSETRGKLTSLIDEMIGNQKVVQAFGYEDDALNRFDKINETLGEFSLKATFFSSITNPATRFVNGVVYAGVGIVGAIAAVNGVLTVGRLTSFLSYANQYTKPFNEISGVITELQNALASAARVFELMEEEPQVPDAEDAVVLADVDGNVEMDHVYFSYTPEQKLIENFNLNVKPGQRIAIVGPTGCGKSTVINLLMRFYEINSGKITLDGVDTASMTRKELRSHFGMVLQDTWLFGGTIAENIAYGRPDATMEEIQAAAKAARVHHFVSTMSDGYHTVLDNDVESISVGQRQLLTIARVVLCDPAVLILDEATSSVDTRTEHEINRAMKALMKNRTSFVIAHRLSTIVDADLILVMDKGNIIEQGNHDSLMAQGGAYAELYNSQFAS